MFRRFAFVLVVVWAVRAWAGPDDDFITLYNLIQVTDSQRDAGRTTEARAGYLRAQQLLRELQRGYPTWNERVIAYRLRYVAEKLASLPETPLPPITVAPAKRDPAKPDEELAPSGEVIEQFNQLNSQIARLASEKQVLEAKLREAFTAQPAPVDPQELSAAIESISQLQSTNKVLIAELARQQAERRNLVDKVVADEAQQALNEANRQLLAQRTRTAELEKQRETVEAQLKKFDVENTTLKSQVDELKSDSERGKQIAELTDKLGTLQADLAEVRQQNEVLVADKGRLEKQVEDLRARQSEETIVRMKQLETDLAFAKAESSRQSVVADELANQLAKEKGLRTRVEADNETLARRVQALTEQNTSLKGLETQLSAEKTERQEVEAQLKAAEERLAALQVASALPVPAADTIQPAANEALAAQMRLLETEAARLRDTLKDSRARETELSTLLTEATAAREQLEREKQNLLARLSQAPRSPAQGELVRANQAISTLETRVRELERERDQLTAKVNAATTKSASSVARLRRTRLGDPRSDAARFRMER
jgi:chromosome segregation ATPase